MEDNQPQEGLQFFDTAEALEQQWLSHRNSSPVQEEVVETHQSPFNKRRKPGTGPETPYVDPEVAPMAEPVAEETYDDSEEYLMKRSRPLFTHT